MFGPSKNSKIGALPTPVRVSTGLSLRRWTPCIWRAGQRVALVGWDACQGWVRDRCASMAASLAFYAAFSIAPMLIIVITVAGTLFGVDAVSGHLFDQARGIVGADGAGAIQALVKNAWLSRASHWTPWISVGAIVLGASATFSELDTDLNIIWGNGVRRRASSPWATLVRVRLLSFGLVVGVGFLLMVLLVLDAGMSLFLNYFWTVDPSSQELARVVRHGLSVLFLIMAFAVLLKTLPAPKVRWSDVFIGASAAGVLFAAGKGVFGFYLSHAGMVSTFGAAGALAIILMWLFYSAAVFLFGAELAAAFWRNVDGQRATPPRPGP